MESSDEVVVAYSFLVIFAVLAGVLAYVTLPKCDPAIQAHNMIIQLAVLPYAGIVIGAGLYTYAYPDKKLKKIKSGVITGIATGLGIMAIIAIFIQCIS